MRDEHARSRPHAASPDDGRAGRNRSPRRSPGRTGRRGAGRPHPGRRAGYTGRSRRRPGCRSRRRRSPVAPARSMRAVAAQVRHRVAAAPDRDSSGSSRRWTAASPCRCPARRRRRRAAPPASRAATSVSLFSSTTSRPAAARMPALALAAKPRLRAVADQRDAPLPRQRIQRRDQLRLRRGVVDHDEPARAAQTRPARCRGRRACGRRRRAPPPTHVDRRPARRRRDVAAMGLSRRRRCRRPYSGIRRAGVRPPDRADCRAGPCRRGPAHAADPCSPASAAAGTVKPRGRASRPLSSIVTSHVGRGDA